MPWRPLVACVTVMPCSSSVLVIAKTLRGSSSITRTRLPCRTSWPSVSGGVRSRASAAWMSAAGSLISAGTWSGWAADRCSVMRSRNSSSDGSSSSGWEPNRSRASRACALSILSLVWASTGTSRSLGSSASCSRKANADASSRPRSSTMHWYGSAARTSMP